MIIRYTVKVSAKQRLKGDAGHREATISHETIDRLSDSNAEVLEGSTSYDLSLKGTLEEDLDEFDLCLQMAKQLREKQAEKASLKKAICEYVLAARPDDLWMSTGYTYNYHMPFKVREVLPINSDTGDLGAKNIPWNASPEMEAKEQEVENFVKKKIVEYQAEVDRREQEKEREQEESAGRRRLWAKQREAFILSLLDNVDKERREEKLLSDSEARGLIIAWVLRQLPAFDISDGAPEFLPAKGSEDLVDYDRDCMHVGEFDCTWQSLESKSLSKEEFLEYKDLQKAIESVPSFKDAGVKVEVEPRQLSYGCDCEGCSERLVGISGIKMSITVGDWNMNKLFIFRASFI